MDSGGQGTRLDRVERKLSELEASLDALEAAVEAIDRRTHQRPQQPGAVPR